MAAKDSPRKSGAGHSGDRAPEVKHSRDPADFFYMGLNVPCQRACPAYTNIPAYIRALYEEDYQGSYQINRGVNIFPAVLGRVCSRPCEDMCRHGESDLGLPVNICHIKRAAADLRHSGSEPAPPRPEPLGKRVGVIGSGPAGLAAAHDLATLGFAVVLLEALDKPGGMLNYGIPIFRLPREILQAEIDYILSLGVELRCGVKVGQDPGLDELLAEFDAVLLAAGCYRAIALQVPGEDLAGVYSGLDFMMRICGGEHPAVGERVLVLGAGFTAFDCARSALRLGAQEVSICLRRTENELVVTKDEILEAKREAVRFESLLVAQKILGQDKVEGVQFVRTKLGEPAKDGRRRVIPIEGSEFILAADTVIVATGQRQEPIPGPAESDERGVPRVAAGDFQSSRQGLYVCGDYVSGPSTVIEAVASGRRAAEEIARDLTGRRYREAAVRMVEAAVTDRQRTWDYIPRQEMPVVEPVAERLQAADLEVELGLDAERAAQESRRCYLCYLHYEIDLDKCIYCRYCIDVAPRDCIKLVKGVETNEQGAIVAYEQTTSWREVNAVVIDNARCIRCGECLRVCPVDCISVTRVEQVERLAGARER